MSMPQPAGASLSSDALVRFERELHEARRSHEARLEETPEFDDISIAIRQRSEDALSEVLAALARIDDGSFGLCESCLSPINADRLEAIPHTPHCVGCATNADRERARR